MFDTLRAYFEDKGPLTTDQLDLMRSVFIPKQLTKGAFLLREGEVAKYGAFVALGCLRSYAVDNKGKEHILQFAPEKWWISNFDSMANGVPSTYFIDAIEHSDVLLIDKPSFEKLLAAIPTFASSFQSGIQKHTSSKEKRIIASLSASAEERYTDFLHTYPSIARRIPQHMLASYLGVSPETLSRIRKQLSQKK